jgi:hypothetical protein
MSKLHYHCKDNCGYLRKDYLRFVNGLLKEGKRLYEWKK